MGSTYRSVPVNKTVHVHIFDVANVNGIEPRVDDTRFDR